MLECSLKFADARKPIPWIFRQRLEDDPFQFGGYGWIHLSGGDRRPVDDVMNGFGKGGSVKRELPRQKLIEHDRGGEEVGSAVDSGGVDQLLGGTVMNGSQETLILGFDQFRFFDSGDPEVGDLHGSVLE